MYYLTEKRIIRNLRENPKSMVVGAEPPFYDRPQAPKYTIPVKKCPPRAHFSVKWCII